LSYGGVTFNLLNKEGGGERKRLSALSQSRPGGPEEKKKEEDHRSSHWCLAKGKEKRFQILRNVRKKGGKAFRVRSDWGVVEKA